MTFRVLQELAHKYYRAKHQQGASQQWSNFTFYRMENIRYSRSCPVMSSACSSLGLLGFLDPLGRFSNTGRWIERNLTYDVLECSDIYFVGGFGTVQWVDVEEYDLARPDLIAVNGAEKTLQVCYLVFRNSTFLY